MTPYPIIRKLFSEFGLDVLAAEAVKNMLDRERARQHDGELVVRRRAAALRAWASRSRWRRS